MSIFPIFVTFWGCFIPYMLFFWKIQFLVIVLMLSIVSIIMYIYDCINNANIHYESAFWLFIFSEIMVFGSLLLCCLYFDTCYYENLSSPLEIPFLGCFILLGSSVTITAFHHLINWENSSVLLIFTILLGFFFVVLQICEMNEIVMNIYDTSFHASSFCTIGLHFSHVIIGIIGLITLLYYYKSSFSVYNSTILTWYWHFVDYVWLFVYTFVYVC